MKTLNQSIITIRVKLQEAKLKKSGKNKFAGFDYFELSDFLPKLNELMLEEGVNDRFYIKDDYATLELVKDTEKNTYTIPFFVYATPANKNGVPSMQDIQYLGALNTYYKRYLYLNAFGITDGEVIDSMDNGELEQTKKEEVVYPKATAKQIEILNNLYKEEELPKIYEWAKVNDLADLTINQASALIGKRKGGKNNG